MILLLRDLQLTPEDPRVLMLAWKWNASQQCEFSRDEFMKGMADMQCDSIEKLRHKLYNDVTQELNDPAKFKDFYQFTFTYAKGNPVH